MAAAGVSSLGLLLGYAGGTFDTKPSSFTLLTRINAIGGIALETEQIDASALEDLVTRYVAGRADSGGTFPVTVNLTDETIDEWKTVIDLSKTQVQEGNTVWFEVYSPNLDDAFYICAETPQEIPMPDFEQNSLMTVEIVLVINEYKGLDTAIEPEGSTGSTGGSGTTGQGG